MALGTVATGLWGLIPTAVLSAEGHICCHSESIEPGAWVLCADMPKVLLLLLPGAAPPTMSTPAGSCFSVGCSPGAPETASDSAAPGLAHP